MRHFLRLIFLKKPTDDFVIAEPFYHREYIVLNTAQCGGCNLGYKACALTLPESEIGYVENQAYLDHMGQAFGDGATTCRCCKLSE